LNTPGQPQNNAVPMVRMMPSVRFSTIPSSDRFAE
jgi:hypothetical protein